MPFGKGTPAAQAAAASLRYRRCNNYSITALLPFLRTLPSKRGRRAPSPVRGAPARTVRRRTARYPAYTLTGLTSWSMYSSSHPVVERTHSTFRPTVVKPLLLKRFRLRRLLESTLQ